MLTTLVLVISGAFVAHGKPAVGSFQQPNGPSPFLVGGSNANTGEFPYMLSLQFLSATTGWGHFCGAVLYKTQFAITTAHCVDNKQISSLRVVAGAVLLQNDVNRQEILLRNYTTHPGYEVATPGLPNDIAILDLSAPVLVGGTAQNALLPPDDTNLFVQTNCDLCGWGQTTPSNNALPNQLQKLRIPVINNTYCAEELVAFDNAAIFDTSICTLSPGRNSGTCDADNGSPLTCCRSETDCSVKYVVGITSYFVTISGECDIRYPAVHVRTSKYLAWIESETP